MVGRYEVKLRIHILEFGGGYVRVGRYVLSAGLVIILLLLK